MTVAGFLAGDFHLRRQNFISVIVILGAPPWVTVKERAALLLSAWREASGFFLSIELWLMVMVAGATVGGFWLAVLGDAWSLLSFGFAFGYIAARSVLHGKRILCWPFI